MSTSQTKRVFAAVVNLRQTVALFHYFTTVETCLLWTVRFVYPGTRVTAVRNSYELYSYIYILKT